MESIPDRLSLLCAPDLTGTVNVFDADVEGSGWRCCGVSGGGSGSTTTVLEWLVMPCTLSWETNLRVGYKGGYFGHALRKKESESICMCASVSACVSGGGGDSKQVTGDRIR